MLGQPTWRTRSDISEFIWHLGSAVIFFGFNLWVAMMLIAAFLVGAAIVGQFGIDTRDRRFEDVAP